jgi:hypothetical protein
MFEAVTNISVPISSQNFYVKILQWYEVLFSLADPTKKSVKIPNSKLRYAFCCPLSRPLQLMKTCQSSIKQSTQQRCFNCILECPITKYNSIALHTFGRSDTSEFLFWQIFITWWEKKFPAMHTKDFCEKKVPKLLDFEDLFLEIMRFDQ